MVAHNLAFDAPFLAHQFRQLGVQAPLDISVGLCTMMLAATYLPEAGRSLAACCKAADIPLENAHCALDDTRAAAMLLARYLRIAGSPPPWNDLVNFRAGTLWPNLPTATPFVPIGRRPRKSEPSSFLGRLVDHLPRVVSPPAADNYLAMLDRALIDRQISETEADALVALARRFGLGRDDVLSLHDDYLADLGAAARADGVVTEAEEQELYAVARLLGPPPSAVVEALTPKTLTPKTLTPKALTPKALTPKALTPKALTLESPAVARIRRQAARRFSLRPGDTVVFTGQTREPRELLEQRARDAGLRVDTHVTRDAKLVVAADVDTMSAKARTARDYGVPIIGVDTFTGFLAEMRPSN